MTDKPKHGDIGTCRHCGKPVEFWDGNAYVIEGTGHWLHTGRTYAEGAGAQPGYCDETRAEV
jgi:hypothetical protein